MFIVVNNLVEKELIEEYERLMVPGRPLTYRTTANFLRAFGLTSLADLPLLPDNLADPSNHENKDADVQADELPNDD